MVEVYGAISKTGSGGITMRDTHRHFQDACYGQTELKPGL